MKETAAVYKRRNDPQNNTKHRIHKIENKHVKPENKHKNNIKKHESSN